MSMTKKTRKKRKICMCILLVLGGLLVASGNILVNIALIPSTMEKLDAFSEITEESVEALVHTDDIQQNHEKSVKDTVEWLQEVQSREVEQRTEDGYRLVGRAFLQTEESHRWVLLLHGYTGWKEEMYPFACRYWQKGYQVVVPDMRCQGESEGDYIGMGYTDGQDNLLWLEYILQTDPKAEIVLHGQSMGAACGLIMAGREDLPDNVKAVVSDCAYTDAYTMFQKQMKAWFSLPSFPLLNVADVMLQIRGGYSLKDASALDGAAKSQIPLLIIHGTEDEMIPVEMAYELYEAANCPRELLIVEGAGHAQAPDKDPEKYYETIFHFLDAEI